MTIRYRLIASLLAVAATANAADLAFSDPANVTPMPSWAVGTANRAPDFDVLPGFQKPPPGFGTVPFFWWLGDPLTKERLVWELDKMAGMGVSGYQINYAHSDKGGRSYGLTYPSQPALFSEDWWSLTGWFMQEAKKQNASVSLSDYTLGFGQGWCVDEILREHPDVVGQQLRMDKDGKVTAETVAWSLNPMHPMSGKWYSEKFFGQFEKRFPREGGKGLNFFFSDELGFGVSGRIWSAQFADEFKKRKGYDIAPELAALFKDVGPRTPKIRLDYSDVVVALSEEGFFKPVFDWHQQRGMIMGCDHGGRGQNVVEFGDYFRTQRWNQGPGADQPGLGRNLIKAKVAASIAHLYERPRVWLEGFYGSGWGTTSAGVVDATFVNYVRGFNLFGIHGMYYATHGGWWEWAPPDNTFRMPYWRHMQGFMDCVQRLSYILSQGYHRCDVAIIYPVAPMEAGMDGQQAVQTAFSIGEHLYSRGVDFDFMDFESLDRAKVVGKELHVSGEIYRALVLPSMKAVRWSTIQKAAEFSKAGGIVIVQGAVPEATDRAGREDPDLTALVGTLNNRTSRPEQTLEMLTSAFPRDYDGPGQIQHRRIGTRDIYAVYDAPLNSECVFRAIGKVELWDPWNGTLRPLDVISQTFSNTTLRLPLSAKEMQLIVFSPGNPKTRTDTPEKPVTVVVLDGEWEFELQPMLDNRFGDFHWPPTPTKIGAEVRQLWYCEGDNTNGPWRKVTHSFGPQFIQSASMPPESEAKRYEFSWRWGIEGDPGHQGYHGLKEEMHDEFLAIGKARKNPGHSPNVTSYEDAGDAYFSTAVIAPQEMKAIALTGPIKPAEVRLNGEVISGQSLRLKAGSNPIVLKYTKPGRTWFVVSTSPGKPFELEEPFSSDASWIWYPGDRSTGDRWFNKTFNLANHPSRAYLRITCDNSYSVKINDFAVGNGTRWETIQEYDIAKFLRAGKNEIVVRAHNDGADAGLIAELVSDSIRVATDESWVAGKTEAGAKVPSEKIGSFADSIWFKHPSGPPRLELTASNRATEQLKVASEELAMTWWTNTNRLPFDVRHSEATPVGWYRFESPPGFTGFVLKSHGRVRAWADGKPMSSSGSGKFYVAQRLEKPVIVVLRIEQERGFYGGAAFDEPIRVDCGPGKFTTGDWAKNESLFSYSGGAWYRRNVTIPISNQVILDLGSVAASADIRVNGKLAGIKVSEPWRLDITPLVQPGDNLLEILVCNALANHYTTVPTQYRGSTTSGLLGSVRLELK